MNVAESRSRVMLGLQGRVARARVFTGLQVILGPGDGCIGGVEFGGRTVGGTGSACCGNGLPSIAHFLNRRASLAAEKAYTSEQNSHEPQHRARDTNNSRLSRQTMRRYTSCCRSRKNRCADAACTEALVRFEQKTTDE
jgi:hypothetical protein